MIWCFSTLIDWFVFQKAGGVGGLGFFLKIHLREQFIYNSSQNEIGASTGRMLATKGLLLLLLTAPCVFADKEESREVVVEVDGGQEQVA